MNLNNKNILITGACGTVGSELVNQLLEKSFKIKSIICLDNDESSVFYFDQKYIKESRVEFFVTDIRDIDELNNKMKGVDIVFHAAALKHVILCEKSPEQAVQTNVQGVQNIIAASNANNVKIVVFTSSDKAVNPTNVMGVSKLMGERLMTAANRNKVKNGPVFVSTRFGNVLGSSGSVMTIFKEQIKNKEPLTITHPEMTRFIMSIKEAVKLVIETAKKAKGGEVFVTKMPAIKIVDLAKAMIQFYSQKYGYAPSEFKLNEIGIKPGEKIYEELMSEEETKRSLEYKDYFIIYPALGGEDILNKMKNRNNKNVKKQYISESEKQLDHKSIIKILKTI